MKMTASNISIPSESDISHRHLIIRANWSLTFSQGRKNIHFNTFEFILHVASPLVQPNNSYSDLCQSRLKFMVDIPTTMIPDSYFTAKLFEHLEDRLNRVVEFCFGISKST